MSDLIENIVCSKFALLGLNPSDENSFRKSVKRAVTEKASELLVADSNKEL